MRPWEACAAWNESRLLAESAAARAKILGAALTADHVQQAYGALLPKLRGRRIVFMGDSLHRQLFVSFACLLHSACPPCFTRWNAYWFPATPRLGPGQGKKCHSETRCDFSSATIEFDAARKEGGANASFELHTCEVNDWRGASSGSLATASPSMSKCMKRFHSLRSKDVLIYGSTGLHAIGRNTAMNSPAHLAAYAKAEVQALLYNVNRTYSTARRPHILWRELTAPHWDTPTGFFYPGLNISLTRFVTPWLNRHFCSANQTAQAEGNSWNAAANAQLAAIVPILRVWDLSITAHDAHTAFGDCTHFCLPGVPDAWSRQLAGVLRSLL